MLGKRLRKRTERRLFASRTRAEVFGWIYATNKWGSNESVSGKGSELGRTKAIRAGLPDLLCNLEVRSLLDLPCGDLNWLDQIELPDGYIGADIVRPLIHQNRQRYPRRRFMVLDACRDALPTVDLILMRDLLVHLSFADINLVLENLRISRSAYLACTTYPDLDTNVDKLTGKHRRLNLLLPPFRWPPPLHLLDEQDRHGKALGIWRLDDLKRAVWAEP